MKIISKGKVLNSQKFYKKKRIKKLVKIILFLVLFFSVIFSLIYFSRQEQFLIAEVSVLEKDAIDKEEIIRITKDLLSGYYLWVIPRANSLIYPRRTIQHRLLKEFPRLESVNLDLNKSQKLLIEVRERIPFALYCVSTLNPENASDCYFLDKESFIFALAPSFSGVVYFVFATTRPIEEPIGQELMAIEEFKSLLDFIENLSDFNIEPLALELDDDRYSLVLESGGQIIWQRDDDFALVYSNLEAFLSDEAIQSQEDFLDKILYLDLRTENKVHWKFKNE